MADYKRIIRSSPHTLLVGKDHTRLTIHIAAVQHISESLYKHICDDSMKSPADVTVLEDVEAETFIGFCEYVYTGTYVTADFAPTEHNEDGLSLETQEAPGGGRSRMDSEIVLTPGSEPELEPCCAEPEPELAPEPEPVPEPYYSEPEPAPEPC
ncbi:hypothetical protein BDV41DRAFT_791 [Aspergillus transmontanensis]|uniref:BTB domain-containing protein n=1 Tax=Aspergillus transmontanensis TaxID=1034304 RepID=A0A5N6WGQ2_9EURO|nr:hypothetical protein BDV41DRAFT_791 [Aspergillus transmontanensis]